jgi:hypothetical protein
MKKNNNVITTLDVPAIRKINYDTQLGGLSIVYDNAPIKPNNERLAEVVHLLPMSVIKWVLLNDTWFVISGPNRDMVEKILNITEPKVKGLLKEMILLGYI